jgi:hypothetical protein
MLRNFNLRNILISDPELDKDPRFNTDLDADMSILPDPTKSRSGALEIRIGLQYISGYFNKKEMSATWLVKATSPSLKGLSSEI